MEEGCSWGEGWRRGAAGVRGEEVQLEVRGAAWVRGGGGVQLGVRSGGGLQLGVRGGGGVQLG